MAKAKKDTKKVDFRGKTADELKSAILERKKELFNLRFQRAAGEQPNNARFKQVRREIARAMTELNAPKTTAKAKKAA